MIDGVNVAGRTFRRRRPRLRVMGFPVRVKPGFLVFCALIVALYEGTRGLWFAGSLALLTLTHELGHAWAARSCGAEAEIALDFMAGYTSFSPSQPLSNGQRAGIAVAGPLAEIVPGLVALLVLGANPFSIDSVTATDARLAIWWSGPILGLVNLLPLVPLDGGSILSAGLDGAAPGRGRQWALWWSLGASLVAVAVAMAVPGMRPMIVFFAFLIILQVRQLLAIRARQARPATGPVVVVRALLDDGRPLEAAHEGSRRFEVARDPALAVLVARAAARLGQLETAMAWLQAAGHATPDPAEVLADLDLEPDFAELRDRPAARTLRWSLGG